MRTIKNIMLAVAFLFATAAQAHYPSDWDLDAFCVNTAMAASDLIDPSVMQEYKTAEERAEIKLAHAKEYYEGQEAQIKANTVLFAMGYLVENYTKINADPEKAYDGAYEVCMTIDPAEAGLTVRAPTEIAVGSIAACQNSVDLLYHYLDAKNKGGETLNYIAANRKPQPSWYQDQKEYKAQLVLHDTVMETLNTAVGRRIFNMDDDERVVNEYLKRCGM